MKSSILKSLLILLAIAGLGKSPSALAVEPVGYAEWGGRGAQINLIATPRGRVAEFQFNCAKGEASQWAHKGQLYIAQGTETLEPPVIQIGHPPQPRPVVYIADVREQEMNLEIIHQDGSRQRFELRKGAKSELQRCK